MDDNATPVLLYGSKGYPTDLNDVVMNVYTFLGSLILGPKCYSECVHLYRIKLEGSFDFSFGASINVLKPIWAKLASELTWLLFYLG